MTTTKKGFLKAGTIIGIISACLGMIFSIFLLVVGTKLQEKHIVEIYKLDTDCQYFENEDGSYYFKDIDLELGEEEIIDEKDIEISTKIIKNMLIVASCADFVLSFILLILSSKLLSKTKNDVYSKNLTISMIVLSAITGEIIVMALMIVALCLKNKNSV